SRCSAEGAPGAHQSRDRRDGDPRGGGLAWTGEADSRAALGTGAWNPTTPCPRGTGSMGLGLCVGAARRGGQPPRFPPPSAPAQGTLDRVGPFLDSVFTLDRDSALPPEMVRIPGGDLNLFYPGFEHIKRIALGDYLMDRFEVTNREFKRFVDAGGYRRRDLWD